MCVCARVEVQVGDPVCDARGRVSDMGDLSGRGGKFEVTQVHTPESALSASTPLSPQSLLVGGDISKQRLLPQTGDDYNQSNGITNTTLLYSRYAYNMHINLS